MNWLEEIVLQGFAAALVPAVFVGAFFFGDSVIIAAFVFALRTDVSLPAVFFAALAGTLIADAVWYLFGSRIFVFLKNNFRNYYEKGERTLEAIGGFISLKKPWRTLLLVKFLYGTRILFIVYLSFRRMRPLAFALYDTLATALYQLALLVFATLTVSGAARLFPSVGDISIGLAAFAVSLLVIRILTKWITERFSGKKT